MRLPAPAEKTLWLDLSYGQRYNVSCGTFAQPLRRVGALPDSQALKGTSRCGVLVLQPQRIGLGWHICGSVSLSPVSHNLSGATFVSEVPGALGTVDGEGRFLQSAWHVNLPGWHSRAVHVD